MTELTEKIKKIVIKEDNQKLYPNHIALVVKYCLEIATIEKEDLEVVEIAALLHDIGRLRYGGKDHNITGANDARKMLESEYYNPEKIGQIYNAILAHGGNGEHTPKSIVDKILCSADGLSHLDIVPILLDGALQKTKGNLQEAVDKVENKLKNEWENKIVLNSAKKKGIEKYKEAINYLENSRK